MRTTQHGFNLADTGGTLTSNTVVGAGGGGNGGYNFTESGGGRNTLGSFDNNTAHSGAGYGLVLSCNGLTGTMSGFSTWRNTNCGIGFGGNNPDLIFNNLICFGNSSTGGNIGMNLATNLDALNITGASIVAGDTTFPCSYGILASSLSQMNLNLSGVDMSGTTSIYAAHTANDFSLNTGSLVNIKSTMSNCKFGAPNVFSSKATWSLDSYVSVERYGQTAGDHRTEMAFGQLKTDTVIYNSASPSMRMTPNSASNKLESAPKGRGFKIPVTSGNAAAISVYVYKSKTVDGAAYNGSQPRLIQRAKRRARPDRGRGARDL
jgi:hypothetical protein